MNDFFIAVYTNQCKEYCDKIFFENLQSVKSRVYVIDNTKGFDYTLKLKSWGFNVDHITIQYEKRLEFLLNVVQSVNVLRDMFLKTDCKYFVTLESDVIPPEGWLDMFMEVIDKADIIGGVYYDNFHKDYTGEVFDYTYHVLSGCTLYKRYIIEKYWFRADAEQPNNFPDAFMCWDANKDGYKFGNYYKIRCKHLAKPDGTRGMGEIK